MIKNHKLEEFINKKVELSNKIKYGEVNTPINFIQSILSIIDPIFFSNPDLKWLDPGCGSGNFSITLFYLLDNGLKDVTIDKNLRQNHIIENMIYMIEIQESNINILKNIFGINANIIHQNFLTYDIDEKYDIIIGNPPFNYNGIIKVPTSNKNKKQDGKTIWHEFINKSLSLLKNHTGLLCVFIPSIWLKPDKKGMNNKLLSYKIENLNCFSNTETNKIFKGMAQTPSCFFKLQNIPSNNYINIFDKKINKYVNFKLEKNMPIPIFAQSICLKFKPWLNNNIKVNKTNMYPKNSLFSNKRDENYNFINISTCKLEGLTPKLVIKYSNILQPYYGKPKLVLAHKMYGFPYLDICGNYGICNRDNYVIMKDSIDKLIKLQKFLSTKTALYMFEACRYRMKYLEKYVFELLPDISELSDFPDIIDDNTISDYFKFSKEETDIIKNFTKKNYKFFE